MATLFKIGKDGWWTKDQGTGDLRRVWYAWGELLWENPYLVLPTTDRELQVQGWRSVEHATDGGLWLCDEASGNLIDEINAEELAPQDSPTQDAAFGTPTGKKGVETYSIAANMRFQHTDASKIAVGTADFTVSMLLKPHNGWRDPGLGIQTLCGKYNAAYTTGWEIRLTNSGTKVNVILNGTNHVMTLPKTIVNGAAHLVTVAVDRNGYIYLWVDGEAYVSIACGVTASVTGDQEFCICNLKDTYITTYDGQMGWLLVNVGTAEDGVGHAALSTALGLS